MIDTLSNVKAALLISGTADDALLTRLMAGADGFIAQHTGQYFPGGTFGETYPAGRNLVFLTNYPVSNVTSVKVDPARQFGSDTVRDATTYLLHAARGVIESLTGPFLAPRGGIRDDWPAAVQVVYSTPTGAVPALVQEAFTQLIAHWYRQVKTFADQEYQMLVEQYIDADAKVWPWSLATGLKVPPAVLELLAAYHVPAV